MLSITGTDEWRAAHPGAVIGLLELSEVGNAQSSEVLEEQKRQIEAHLRVRYAGCTRKELQSLPVMADYVRYYKGFDKTYHVLLQLESILQKGKDLPSVSPLVDSNFAAEVETLVLTAGHDVGRLRGPVVIDVSREGDHMTQMNGEARTIRAGDMIMRDKDGVSCSIIYGQDNRSPISAATRHVLYVAYAPSGILREAVESQLARIEENVRLFAPDAVREQQRLLSA